MEVILLLVSLPLKRMKKTMNEGENERPKWSALTEEGSKEPSNWNVERMSRG